MAEEYQNQIIQCEGYCFKQNSFLGSGVQGTVYQGFKKNDKSFKVAVKVINIDLQQISPQDVKKLVTQVSIQTSLDRRYCIEVLAHGIVQVTDKQYDHKILKYCIIQEHMNKTLSAFLKQKQKKKEIITQIQAINYMKKILLCYKCLYDRKIIHRDIKPQNILIKIQNQQEIIKIADFGISKFSSDLLNHTKIGNDFYQAPQQKLGDKGYSDQCDVYAFGVLFFKLLNGKTPYQLKITNQKTLKNDYEKLKKQLQKLNISKKVIDFINKCLQFQQDNRFTWEQIFNHSIFMDSQQIYLTPSAKCSSFAIDSKNPKKCRKNQQFGYMQSKQELPKEGNYQFSIRIFLGSNQKSPKFMIGIITGEKDRLDFDFCNKAWYSTVFNGYKDAKNYELQLNNYPSIISLNINLEKNKARVIYNQKVQSQIDLPEFNFNQKVYANIWQEFEGDSFQFI